MNQEFEDHTVGDIESPERYNKQVEETTRGLDANTFSMLNSSVTTEDSSLLDNPILKQLCDPSKYKKDDPSCNVCKKELGFLNPRRICKFCGSACCDHCSQKRRADPQNKSPDFERICDKCDLVYLKKVVYDEYLEEKNEIDKILYKQTEELKTKQKVLKGHHDELNNLDNKYQVMKKEFEEAQGIWKGKITRVKIEQEKLIIDNNQNNEIISQFTDKQRELQEKTKATDTKILSLRARLNERNKEIQARHEDISNIQRMTEAETKKLAMDMNVSIVGGDGVTGSIIQTNNFALVKLRPTHLDEANFSISNNPSILDSSAKNERVSGTQQCSCSIF